MEGDDTGDGGEDFFAPLLITTDASEAEMIGELMRREGVAARVVRVNGPLLGVPQHLFETRVDVPREQLAFARELLAEMEYSGAAEAADQPAEAASPAAEAPDEDEDEDGDGDEDGEPGRPIRGVGIMSFIPGVCHLSARRPWTALVLATGILACLGVLIVTSNSERTFRWLVALAFFTGLAILAGDLGGGMKAALTNRLGIRVSRKDQIRRGHLLLLIALASGAAVTAALAVPGWLRARRLERFAVSCSAGTIAVENRGGEAQTVTIERVDVEVTELAPRPSLPYWYPTTLGGPTTHLAPGAAGEVGFTAEEGVVEACASSGTALEEAPPTQFLIDGAARPVTCRLQFSFVAAASDETRLAAVGHCIPAWSRPTARERGWLVLRE